METRRIKQLVVTREGLANLFQEGQLYTSALPKNSRILSLDRRPQTDDYLFTVFNPNFDKIEEGEDIPHIEIQVTDTNMADRSRIGQTNTQKMY